MSTLLILHRRILKGICILGMRVHAWCHLYSMRTNDCNLDTIVDLDGVMFVAVLEAVLVVVLAALVLMAVLAALVLLAVSVAGLVVVLVVVAVAVVAVAVVAVAVLLVCAISCIAGLVRKNVCLQSQFCVLLTPSTSFHLQWRM